MKGADKKKQQFGTFLSQWRTAHTRLHPADAATTVSSQCVSLSVYVQLELEMFSLAVFGLQYLMFSGKGLLWAKTKNKTKLVGVS